MNNIIQICISYIVSSIYFEVHRTIYIDDQKGSVEMKAQRNSTPSGKF